MDIDEEFNLTPPEVAETAKKLLFIVKGRTGQLTLFNILVTNLLLLFLLQGRPCRRFKNRCGSWPKTDPDFPIYPRPSSGKRALAMFARWGSINSIGKNRPPIRSNPYDSDGDDTYNSNRRMQGQPLRWG
ncbi:uncharacterized protein LOC126886338 [Diabrotica virgifera virgifera]|uniref:Uncharacterized protein n=1 Tax=Diabrotica virgifera virgifera TaxID=50390 RepID=A0ABM5KG87_DIAVI|nr:uncharacterized protein LOC126886338 [Diabrotica virgifera virgifera]